MRRWVPIALLGLLIGGCGGSDGKSKAAPVATSTSTSAVASTSGVAAVGDLADVVVTDAPPPYVSAPTDIPGGPFDLESFLADFSIAEREDRAMLTACGFTRGFSRAWVDNNTGRVLGIFVFECSSQAAANSLRDAMEEQSRRTKAGTAFDTPTIAGAQGQTYLEDVDDGKARVDVVDFVRGSRLYSIGAQSDSTQGHSDLAIKLATSEAAVAR